MLIIELSFAHISYQVAQSVVKKARLSEMFRKVKVNFGDTRQKNMSISPSDLQ